MKRKIKKNSPFSELRMDLVSNDWIIIATGRAKKPNSFSKETRIKESISPKECAFCSEKIIKKAVSIKKKNNSWFVLSMPNDFPAFAKTKKVRQIKKGPYRAMDGFGFQEVVVTADHKKQIGQFSKEEIKLVIDLYQERYIALSNEKFIKYVSIFHNHGREAGASMSHPHSQIIAIPVLDPDLHASIDGAKAFYKNQGKCVYCTMLEWDLKEGKRIVYENEKFIVLCPFAPQASFETRIYPKEHSPRFEKMNENEKKLFADALQKALSKLYKGLDDPPYNFYIHTAPCDGGRYEYYHWHLNILPRMSIWAGFELSVGIETSTIEPEKAASFLRKIK